MKFNDVSGGLGLIQDCEDYCLLGPTGISSSTALMKQFTRNINAWYQKVVTMIISSQDDWEWDDSNNSDYPIATTPLVANQRDYVFPGSLKILKLKRADISYDGTTWYQITPFDSGAYTESLGNDTTVDARFTSSEPHYDVKGNSVWIYPRATSSTGSLRVEFFREPTEFATDSTTTEPGFDEPFHRMLSLGASYDYCSIKGLPHAANYATQLQEYELRLRQYYGKKNNDINLTFQSGYPIGYGK
jgi:hypothetical protein